jgi:hypothetical protein
MSNYILDENKNPVAVPDTLEGYEQLLAFRTRNFEETFRVALTPIGGGRVSTVFLSIDHNFSRVGKPVLWETMVFDIPGFEGECERYTSHADAVAGHEVMVAKVKKALDENAETV